jgi:antitoxin ChpS
MDTADRWRVVCKGPGDGSGDVIVELPSELLEKLGWTLGDELTIERARKAFPLSSNSEPRTHPSRADCWQSAFCPRAVARMWLQN